MTLSSRAGQNCVAFRSRPAASLAATREARWRGKGFFCRSAAQSSNGRFAWHHELAHKLEIRRDILLEKWNHANVTHGIHTGQDALHDGWRISERGTSVDKEMDVMLEKWRNAGETKVKTWQKNVEAGMAWTNIFGPAIGGIAFAVFGLVWTVIVWGTAIVLFIPYAIVRGRLIDTSTLSAALQIALVQFVTLFIWAAYKGYEWTINRDLTEHEQQIWREDQELQQLHLDELNDFDFRLAREHRRQIAGNKRLKRQTKEKGKTQGIAVNSRYLQHQESVESTQDTGLNGQHVKHHDGQGETEGPASYLNKSWRDLL